MRFLPLVLVLVAGAALAWIALRAPAPTYEAPPRKQATATVPIAIATTPAAGFAIRAYAVDGMCCEGCAAKLHVALTAVDGVQEAAVDVLTGRAQVLVPESASDEPILSALRFEKYTAEPLH